MIKIHQNTNQAEVHFSLVKSLIKEKIKKVTNKGFINTKPKILLSTAIKSYLNDLLKGENLRNLILASPSELPSIVSSMNNSFPAFSTPNSNENLILRNIFILNCYNHSAFDKREFIKQINIDTCPYCNRNYISYLDKKGIIKPQIDHFFPKDKYPYLGVSYYNLIPSCQTCNGLGAKEEKDPLVVDLINPYLIDNTNFRFTYKIRSINFLNPLLDRTSINVILKNNLPGHLNVFKLDKLYEQHSDHVLELVIKSRIAYSSKYRAYLNSYNGLRFSDNEIDRMILGNYSNEDDIHKRPLSKLYQDIGKELGLIK